LPIVAQPTTCLAAGRDISHLSRPAPGSSLNLTCVLRQPASAPFLRYEAKVARYPRGTQHRHFVASTASRPFAILPGAVTRPCRLARVPLLVRLAAFAQVSQPLTFSFRPPERAGNLLVYCNKHEPPLEARNARKSHGCPFGALSCLSRKSAASSGFEYLGTY
jgi:hypothetical protein